MEGRGAIQYNVKPSAKLKSFSELVWSPFRPRHTTGMWSKKDTTDVYKFKLKEHSVKRIPLPRNARSRRAYRAQYIFEISFHISFLAQSLNGEESLFKISDPDPESYLHQNAIISSLSGTQPVHQVSSESVHNFFEISCYISFLVMVKNHWKNYSVRIRLTF